MAFSKILKKSKLYTKGYSNNFIEDMAPQLDIITELKAILRQIFNLV